MPNVLRKQIEEAFDAYAQEGIDAFEKQAGSTPTLSHICLKFQDAAAYQRYVAEAKEIATVTPLDFKGKEISWCRLNTPLAKDGISVEWLEMVEPKTESHPFNGVASIGYCAPGLGELVKISSRNEAMLFRYQGRHVHP